MPQTFGTLLFWMRLTTREQKELEHLRRRGRTGFYS